MACSPILPSMGLESPRFFSASQARWNVSVYGTSESSRSSTSEASKASVAPKKSPPRPVHTKLFPYHEGDYATSSKRPLGKGLWSTVYPAQPAGAGSAGTSLTPPSTPTMRRDSALEPAQSATYAIKTPSSHAARAVLDAEASILSYLDAIPGPDQQHVVPFHGQDPRNGALVLDALPMTLESYTSRLNLLPESERAAELAAVFPTLALESAKGLAFLHSAGVIHADIKPSNILLRPLTTHNRNGHTLLQPLFADFSSSICPVLAASEIGSISTDTVTSATAGPSAAPSRPAGNPYLPLGGGSWDFLAPSLVNPRRPADPSAETDVHALAVTLLSVVVGHSPFDVAGNNAFMRREMVKQGRAMDCVLQDFDAVRRLRNLEVALHWMRGNVQEWLDEGLWARGGSVIGGAFEGGGIEAATWVRQLKERMGTSA